MSPFPVDTEAFPHASQTAERFANPRVGDRFTEMCAVWVHVEAVEPDYIVVREWSGVKDGEPRLFASHDAFRAAYAYTTIPGYWVTYVDNPVLALLQRERQP